MTFTNLHKQLNVNYLHLLKCNIFYYFRDFKNYDLRILLLSIGLLLANHISSQSILFNSSGGSPDPSAIMELQSSEQGFLSPRMNETQRLGIEKPAQGLLVFQTTGTIGFYFYNGTGWDTLGGATTVTNISNVTNITSSGIAVIRDEKAANVDGGTFTTGAWRQRDLNTISGDLSFVTLGSNSFTLDTGVFVITIIAPAYNVNEHQARLYNSTTGTAAAVGTLGFTQQGTLGGGANTESSITAVVEVGASGETFVVQHQCSATNVTTGFGRAVSWGSNVYTQVKIEKL